jgi:hypothetical protein
MSGPKTPKSPLILRQQAIIKSLGSVTSLSFRTTGPGGADIYDVEFVNGHTQ